MSNYDTWLSTNPADVPFPAGVEDALGTIIMWPEGIDEDTLVPEFGEVTDYDIEDGYYVHLEVTNLHAIPNSYAHKMTITLDELDECRVPAELEPIIEKLYEARKAKREAEYAYNRYDNARRQVGYMAVIERNEQRYQERRKRLLQQELEGRQAMEPTAFNCERIVEIEHELGRLVRL